MPGNGRIVAYSFPSALVSRLTNSAKILLVAGAHQITRSPDLNVKKHIEKSEKEEEVNIAVRFSPDQRAAVYNDVLLIVQIYHTLIYLSSISRNIFKKNAQPQLAGHKTHNHNLMNRIMLRLQERLVVVDFRLRVLDSNNLRICVADTFFLFVGDTLLVSPNRAALPLNHYREQHGAFLWRHSLYFVLKVLKRCVYNGFGFFCLLRRALLRGLLLLFFPQLPHYFGTLLRRNKCGLLVARNSGAALRRNL